MARIGNDLVKLRPDAHKVVVNFGEGVFIEGNTLLGVNPADGLAYDIDSLVEAEVESPLILLATTDIDNRDGDPEPFTRDETYTHAVVKLEAKAGQTLADEDVGTAVYATGPYEFTKDSGDVDQVGEFGVIQEVVNDGEAYVWVNRSLNE